MEEAAVGTGQTVDIISRRVVFAGTFFDTGDFFATYDVSRDGSRFLMLQRDDGLDLVAAVNWTAEVRGRVAGDR